MAQIIVYFTLVFLLSMFIWDKIRYDFVALLGLFIISITGVIPMNSAFLGFSNPAVVTVVAVMMISKGMQHSGLLDMVVRKLNWFGKKPISLIFPLSFITAIASAFINNISVIMPISIKLAKKRQQSPSLILMPLAFSTLLGGMTTLFGSSPNIIVSAIRKESFGYSFRLFDFFSVGVILASIGVLYISLIGWRFLPKKRSPVKLEETIEIEDYYTEVIALKESKIVGKTLKEVSDNSQYDINIIGIIRKQQYLHHVSILELVRESDVLMIKADSDSLKTFIDESGVGLNTEELPLDEVVGVKNLAILEVVVMQDSPIIGKTAREIKLRERFNITLLAKTGAKEDKVKRIYYKKFKVGDVLLLQGEESNLPEQIINLGCLALTERGYKIGDEKKIFLYASIFSLSILAVMLKWLPVHIAFPLCALVMVLFDVIPYREVYKSVDWSVIIMLGALIPLGRAMITSGAADHISSMLLSITGYVDPWFIVGTLLVLTMIITNLVHNATAAIIMAPIAIELAKAQGASPDLYLMTVAVGACSAFLTPIAHQANTLVMGPGGYRYSDYWKSGIGLQLINIVVGVPLLLHYWG